MKKTLWVFALWLVSGNGWAMEAVQPEQGRHGGQAGGVSAGSFLITNILTYEVDVAVAVADLPNAGDAVALPKKNISFEGPPSFRLSAGESRPVRYRVQFPSPFNKPAAGAISLVIRTAGADAAAPPVFNRLLPIHLQPLSKDTVLKIEIVQPSVRFSVAEPGVQGSKKIEVGVILKNAGNAPLQPRGNIALSLGRTTLETVSFGGSTMISPGATAVFSGLSQRTTWLDGAYQATLTVDYGDYYGQPLRLSKTYFFRTSGDAISLQPGSATPQKITPR